MKMEEDMVAYLRRRPSIEVEVVTKATHEPIIPNIPTLPKMIFTDLISPHYC